MNNTNTTTEQPIPFSEWRNGKVWEIVEILREFSSEADASDAELIEIALSAIKQTQAIAS